MKRLKALLITCFVLVFFACQINIGKASLPEETDENSPLVEIITLSDGTIERRYLNGTIRHDYFVTAQLQLTMTETATAVTTTTFIWFSDSQEDPFDSTQLILQFLCWVGAETILLMIYKSLPAGRPKPVQRPLPKFPSQRG